MTRRARHGHTQRHSKPPEDATPWEEFAEQMRNKSTTENKEIDFQKDKSTNNNNAKRKRDNSQEETAKPIHMEDKEDSSKQNEASVAFSETEQRLETSDASAKMSQEDKSKDSKTKRSNTFKRKEGTFMERLKEKRQQNGILLLPKKVERKLYLMKKGLRSKGMPEDRIKQTIREIRRKEELKFRKTFKTCFKCREFGHVLADCPMALADVQQGTGICFKCGSTEHSSYKCESKVSGFPFAKCFICQNVGHLSRNCPENKHGVYPRGGECILCKGVDHLMKDCPRGKKKVLDDTEEITADEIGELTSADAEITRQTNNSTFFVRNKKAKVVKF